VATLDYWCRMVVGGLWLLCASVYGLGLCLVRRDPRDIPHDFARLLSPVGLWLGRTRVVVHGAERLEPPQPCLYVANHQSNLDIVVYGAMYPRRTIVIGKVQLRRIPLFGWFFERSGNVMIDRSDRGSSIAGLQVAVDAMRKDGKSIWIFPEGTRNVSGKGLLPFKKGPFHMAVAAQRPLVPILASPLGKVVDFAHHRMPGGLVHVLVLEPIPTEGLTEDDVEGLMARTRAVMEQGLAEVAGGDGVGY
jgi:1-acyl-sn-glycerol-3-phosphate acyltransferase